jgi:glycerol kinase
VPALTGLGAPHWDADARGTLLGITRGTTRAHIARATLDAIAFEVRDVVDAMTDEAGLSVPNLQVDGGASANDLLCQLQADQLGRAGATAAGPGDDRPGRGVPGRPGQRRLVLHRRADRHLAAGPAVRRDGRPRDDGRHTRWLDAVQRGPGWAAGVGSPGRR